MKTRWKIAAFLVVLLGIGVSAIVFVAPIAIERFSPSIAQALSRAVGHPVAFETLSIRFFPTIGVSIHDLRVQSVDTSEKSPAEVRELVLDVSLFDLLSNAITVKTILLRDVTLAVLRDPSGAVFLKGLRPGTIPNPAKSVSPGQNPEAKPSEQPTASASSISLSIEQATFDGINIQFTDETVQPARNVDLRAMSGTFSLENQSGAQSFDVALNGTNAEILLDKSIDKKAGTVLKLRLRGLVANAGKSLTLEQGTLSLAQSDITFTGETLPLEAAKLKIQLSPLNLGDLAALSPTLQDLGLSGTLHGDMLVAAPFDPQGLPLVTGDVEMKQVQLKKSNSPAVEITDGSIAFRGRSVSILNSILTFPGGTAKTEVNFPTLQSGDLALGADVIDIGELLRRTDHPIAALAESTLQGLSIKGTAEPKAQRFVGEIAFGALGTSFGSLTDFRWRGEVDRDSVRLNVAQFGFANGRGELAGTIGLRSPASDLTVQASGMDLEALSRIGARDSAIGLTGTLRSANAKLSFDGKQVKETLTGNATILAGPGSITGLNLLGAIVGKLSETPLLGAALSKQLPPELQQLMTKNDTVFNELRANARFVSGGQTVVEDFELAHLLYRLRGAGEIRPNGSLEFRTRFAFTQPVSAKLVGHSKNLKYALNAESELEVPVRISMSDSNLLVVPDVERLLQNAARSGAVDAAGRALDKVAPGLGGASNVLKGLFK